MFEALKKQFEASGLQIFEAHFASDEDREIDVGGGVDDFIAATKAVGCTAVFALIARLKVASLELCKSTELSEVG